MADLQFTYEQYCDDVVSGRTPVGEYVRLACQRHREDLKRDDLRWEPALAQRPILFASRLTGYKGTLANQPFIMSPWQQFCVATAFGWQIWDKHYQAWVRRFRTIFIAVPRKNGKSTLAAVIGLYLITFDGEMGAQVFTAANGREQARIVFNTAKKFVEHSTRLSRVLNNLQRSISMDATGSLMMPLSKDVRTNDGLDSHGLMLDEMGSWDNPQFYDVLNQSMVARRQPMQWIISYAGDDVTSIYREKWEYAVDVLNGQIEDDTFFGIIYDIDHELPGRKKPDTYFDEQLYQMANPEWGSAINPTQFIADANKIKNKPSRINGFLRAHLNVWTQSKESWIDHAKWVASGQIDEDPRADEVCCGGLDLSRRQDFTAFALAWPRQAKDEPWPVRVWYWLPEGSVGRKRDDTRQPIDEWVRDGYIRTCPGDVILYEQVVEEIIEICAQYALRDIAYDPWNSNYVVEHLQEEYGEDAMVEHRQGSRGMHVPLSEMESMYVARRLAHGNHPVTNWMAANAVVTVAANGHINILKGKATGNIDGIIAMAMAVGRALAWKDVMMGSVYEERGMLVL